MSKIKLLLPVGSIVTKIMVVTTMIVVTVVNLVILLVGAPFRKSYLQVILTVVIVFTVLTLVIV